MKILIISDSHDNIVNIEKILNWAKKNQIVALIHAGDLSAPSVLKNSLAPNFDLEIHLINGNVTDKVLLEEVSREFKHVRYHGDEGIFVIDQTKIFLNHYPEPAEKAASSEEYDLVIHGHTHKAYSQRIGKTLLLNPGTVGGLYNKATFAVYDTEAKSAEISELDKQ